MSYDNPMPNSGYYSSPMSQPSPQSPLSPNYASSPLVPQSPLVQGDEYAQHPAPPQGQQQYMEMPQEQPMGEEQNMQEVKYCMYTCGDCKMPFTLPVNASDFECTNSECRGKILFKVRTEASIQYEAR